MSAGPEDHDGVRTSSGDESSASSGKEKMASEIADLRGDFKEFTQHAKNSEKARNRVRLASFIIGAVGLAIGTAWEVRQYRTIVALEKTRDAQQDQITSLGQSVTRYRAMIDKQNLKMLRSLAKQDPAAVKGDPPFTNEELRRSFEEVQKEQQSAQKPPSAPPKPPSAPPKKPNR